MIEDLSHRAASIRDVASCRDVIADEADRLGFQHFAYVVLRLPDSAQAPFALTSYPDGWVARYDACDYASHDPVFATAQQRLTPFAWAEVRREQRLTRAQRRVFRESAAFGLGDGASVPIHTPGGGFAVLSLATPLERDLDAVWAAARDRAHLAALHVQQAVETALFGRAPGPPVQLTDRERDVLLWTARGKTAWEVAEIVRIAEDTVNFHLKNLRRKLGVHSKHHAVVKAIAMGLILP